MPISMTSEGVSVDLPSDPNLLSLMMLQQDISEKGHSQLKD